MTKPREEDLKKGLTRLVGGQTADVIVRKIREDRALTPLEKKQISSQAATTPLPPEQAEAITAYLGIQAQSSSEGSDKKSLLG